MTLMGWLRGEREDEPEDEPEDAAESFPENPSVPSGTGRLDPRSPTWLFVKAWAEGALKTAREKNDSVNRNEVATAALRGEIKVLKELVNLPNPKKGLLINEEEE